MLLVNNSWWNGWLQWNDKESNKFNTALPSLLQFLPRKNETQHQPINTFRASSWYTATATTILVTCGVVM